MLPGSSNHNLERLFRFGRVGDISDIYSLGPGPWRVSIGLVRLRLHLYNLHFKLHELGLVRSRGFHKVLEGSRWTRSQRRLRGLEQLLCILGGHALHPPHHCCSYCLSLLEFLFTVSEAASWTHNTATEHVEAAHLALQQMGLYPELLNGVRIAAALRVTFPGVQENWTHRGALEVRGGSQVVLSVREGTKCALPAFSNLPKLTEPSLPER
mmetsp:Transcript_22575/g.53233  ORF Transcript_22575/g.53233 Transcript_22575/m.53233 type:complete len:211 (+) Transcript_22575:715-1347(+)